MSEHGDDTPAKTPLRAPWKPGESGNPNGRPKGSRNKLTEDFLGDVLEAWTAKGKEAIDAMITEKPSDFVKMVAGLVPKEATLTIHDADEMSDAELAERVRQLATTLAPFLAEGVGNASADVADAAGPELAARLH